MGRTTATRRKLRFPCHQGRPGQGNPWWPTVWGVRAERELPAVTETVAILFTDVVGSTELSQRLSPKVADEVQRGHFSILRQAIAETGGTEVKNLGDGLMVVFGSASGPCRWGGHATGRGARQP